MAWRSGAAWLTKRAYAEQLAAALALLLLKQRDAVGIVRFDETVTASVAPRARAAHFQRIMGVLAQEPGGRDSRLDLALREAAALVHRPGLVIVLSDLLCDPEPVRAALRALRAGGHDVLVLHILDPGERDLPDGPADARYVDPETGAEVAADARDIRERYRAAAAAAMAQWQRLFLEQGARYARCGTEEPFGLALRRAFAAREALRA